MLKRIHWSYWGFILLKQPQSRYFNFYTFKLCKPFKSQVYEKGRQPRYLIAPAATRKNSLNNSKLFLIILVFFAADLHVKDMAWHFNGLI